MQYLWETTGSIESGVGFRMFGRCHWGWLLAGALFVAACALLYRRLDGSARRRMRFLAGGAVIADELFKMAILFIGGHFTVNYLPLHLCSINVFLVAWHMFRPSRTLDNYLYLICVPGAMAALLFPSWTALPLANLMHIHSFTFHILLVCYPVMLLAAGEIRPELRTLPKVGLLLACLAGIAALANEILGTNFMFLSEASRSNPLYWFKQHMGHHLWGYAVIAPVLVLGMYAPQIIHAARLAHRRHPATRRSVR